MEELIRYLVSILVDDPDAVEVTCQDAGPTVIYQVGVAPDDLGKVIGRHGRTASALRTIVEAASRTHKERASLEILS